MTKQWGYREDYTNQFIEDYSNCSYAELVAAIKGETGKHKTETINIKLDTKEVVKLRYKDISYWMCSNRIATDYPFDENLKKQYLDEIKEMLAVSKDNVNNKK